MEQEAAHTHAAAAEDADQQTAPSSLSGFRRVSLLTLTSRVLGLLRDALMASRFGNGEILDAFTVAFRIPNLGRRLFGEGAMTTAFLPALVSDLEREGRESAWRLTTAVFFGLAAVLFVVVAAGEVLLLGARAALPEGESARLLTGLTAVMFPYLFLICLAALMSAVFHAMGRFGWPAFSPVLLNLLWIAVLFLPGVRSMSVQFQIYAVAWTIVFAGVVQLLLPLLILMKSGFRFAWAWGDNREKVRAITAVMLPTLIGLSVTQLNTLLDSLLAWGLSVEDGAATTRWQPLESGTASALYLGQRLYQFPLGVFGVALGTILFPLFARHAELNRRDLLSADFLRGMKLVLIVGIPASAGLIAVAEPLAAVLFQRGAFDAFDTRQTAEMIAAYGFGVWSFCCLLIVNRFFFALKDARTPMRIGLTTIGFNLVLNLLLIWPLRGQGLALATSLACAGQVTVSLYLLKIHLPEWRPTLLWSTVIRTIAATAVMSAACLAALSLLETCVARIWQLACAVSVSVAIYLLAAQVLGLREVFELFRPRRDAGE